MLSPHCESRVWSTTPGLRGSLAARRSASIAMRDHANPRDQTETTAPKRQGLDDGHIKTSQCLVCLSGAVIRRSLGVVSEWRVRVVRVSASWNAFAMCGPLVLGSSRSQPGLPCLPSAGSLLDAMRRGWPSRRSSLVSFAASQNTVFGGKLRPLNIRTLSDN